MRIAVTDGRYHLAAYDTKYDAIICQPSDPWVAGSADLFTQNFWRLAKSKLTPEGVVSQWIQMYSIEPAHFAMLCRTFASVFPNCRIVYPQGAGECVLLGFNSPSQPADSAIPEAFKRSPMSKASLPAGFESLNAVLSAAIVLNAAQIRELGQSTTVESGQSRLNTDDHNYIEYAVAQNAMTQQQKIDSNIEMLQRFSKASPLSR